ncbi:MAG TPA: VCBS repeat-containing protein [Nevskia sp.]|nr:VCBS repeat-containing protein [Nevskia sp.]
MKIIWLAVAALFASIDASAGGLLDGLTSALSPVAGVPGNMHATDLNSDGKPDILVPETATGWLAVRLNNGDGSFGPVRRYKVGLLPSFIIEGDFNHDGKIDVAVSNAGSGDISVLLGRGDGTFSPAVSYPVSGSSAATGLPSLGAGTFSLVTGDFNGDGKEDIATTNSVTNNVSVLLGKGDGTFSPARTFPIAGAHSLGLIPFALASGDFNHDGRPDLVSGGALSVTILLGNGSGGFNAAASYFVGFDIACVNVADVNGDGIPDIVASGTGTLNLKVLLGKGDGSFEPGENLSSLGIGPQCFSLADLNGDHKADIAVVNSSSFYGVGDLAILLGRGDGTFTDTAANATYPLAFIPWATAVADFNGDGIPDIAVANGFPAVVSILFGNGDGTFRPQVEYPM